MSQRILFRNEQGVVTHDLPFGGEIRIPDGADTFEVVDVTTRADVIDAFHAGLNGESIPDDTGALGDAFVAGQEIRSSYNLES